MELDRGLLRLGMALAVLAMSAMPKERLQYSSRFCILYTLTLIAFFLYFPDRENASLLEDGEDFSNNFVSDQAFYPYSIFHMERFLYGLRISFRMEYTK